MLPPARRVLLAIAPPCPRGLELVIVAPMENVGRGGKVDGSGRIPRCEGGTRDQ